MPSTPWTTPWPRLQYWFTTNPAEIGNEGAPSHFDARDVPAQYQQPNQAPIEWVCSAVRDGFDLDSITNAQPSTAPQTEITMRQISQPANPVFYGIDRCLSDADRPVMFTTPNPFIAAACDQSGQVCALESPVAGPKPQPMPEKELLGRIRENCISQAAAERVAATITTDPVALQALRERMREAFRIQAQIRGRAA